jgi:hypothetical protein
MTDSDIFTARIRATQHAINIGRIARYLATIELGERPFDHPVIDVLNTGDAVALSDVLGGMDENTAAALACQIDTYPANEDQCFVTVMPTHYVLARWCRDADVSTIAKCIAAVLKYEPHTADVGRLRQALEEYACSPIPGAEPPLPPRFGEPARLETAESISASTS